MAGWIARLVALLGIAAASPREIEIGTIDGRPIATDAFARFVLSEQKDGAATEALDHLIQERIVEIESRRRGIVVTEGDVAARLAGLEQRARKESGGKLGLDDQLASTKVDRAEFRRLIRKMIACERMMADDFGTRDEIPPAKQSLWFQEQRARAGVRTAELPAGVAAVIGGDEQIATIDWALMLYRRLPEADAAKLFDEYVGIDLLFAAAKAQGLVVTPQHVAREVQERNEALAAKLRDAHMPTDGVDYLATLKARGDDPDAVLASDRFRAEILLKELTRQRFGADGWRAYYDAHRAEFDQAFGRRVRVATIYLRAEPQKVGKAGRTWAEATAELEPMKARALQGDVPVAEAFASFARLKSEHESAARGGDLGFLSDAQLQQIGLPSTLLEEKPAALLGPMPAPHGVHLLRVLEQRAASPFEEIVGEVEKAARRALLQELRGSAKVERKIQ